MGTQVDNSRTDSEIDAVVKGNASLFIPAILYDSIIAGTWTESGVSGTMLAKYLNNESAAAINDCVRYVRYLAKGTYYCRIRSIGGGNWGKMHLLLDGTDKAQIDAYNLSGNVVSKSSNFIVSETKQYNIDIKIASKNALSTGYRFDYEFIELVRVA